jgi:sporulation protein YlmC with PRC-barrel domain
MKKLASIVLAFLLMSGIVTERAWTQTPTEPSMTEPPATQTLTSLSGDALPVSDYYNQSVYDRQDNEIGDVNDILFDQDGKVSAVIIGVGGFLGTGEKNVAVPFTALKITEKDGRRYLVMDTTKDALEKAPGYAFDRSKHQWLPATEG